MLAGIMVVRFTGWWIGERSDVGGTARARAVEAIVVSKKRSPHGVFIMNCWLCLCVTLICGKRTEKAWRSGNGPFEIQSECASWRI